MINASFSVFVSAILVMLFFWIAFGIGGLLVSVALLYLLRPGR